MNRQRPLAQPPGAEIWDSEQLPQRFSELGSFLHRLRPVWAPRPFVKLPLAWTEDHPEIERWVQQVVRRVPLGQIYETPIDANAPKVLHNWQHEAARLSAVGRFPLRANDLSLRARARAHIPGRKWSQIVDFINAIPDRRPDGGWVDWCAGKGHLGRSLTLVSGTPSLRLELDTALDQAGSHLARRLSAPCFGVSVDVLSRDVEQFLAPERYVVALHACGALHKRQVSYQCEKRIGGLALAPCCYHLVGESEHRPLSNAARREPLALDRNLLGMPLRRFAYASKRRRQLLDREQAWRLGYDLLRREMTGDDSYRSQPSLGGSWTGDDFPGFCRRLAALKGMEIPAGCDFEPCEREGWRRIALVRAYGVVRGLFRRALELWVVSDLALALREAGQPVRLGTFCDAEATPRNLMLLAGDLAEQHAAR